MSDPTPTIDIDKNYATDGTGQTTATVKMSGGTATGPGFSGRYSLKVPAGNYYTISVSADDLAIVSGGDITAASHWDASQKKIISGNATSLTNGIYPGEQDVEFVISYSNYGGPYVLDVTICSIRTKKIVPKPKNQDENCSCMLNCPASTATGNGCIEFSQPFGRTPFWGGFAGGKLIFNEEYLEDYICVPAALCYEHYLTRKVLARNAGTQSATISAGKLWANFYFDGVPASDNSWKSSQCIVNSDGSVREILLDRTEIFYNSAGTLEKVKNARGKELFANQLGVKIVYEKDENGNETETLRQIFSTTDGLLDIIATTGTSFEVRWYKVGDFEFDSEDEIYVPAPEAVPVKKFVFGRVSGNDNAFRITEIRGNLRFENTWIFDESANQWTFQRGNDFTSVRSWEPTNDGNFEFRETKTESGTTANFVQTVSGANGFRYTGQSAGGVQEFRSTRVPDDEPGTGKVKTETNILGQETTYEYDAQGRVTKETISNGFAGETEEKIYEYAAGTSVPVDFRPIKIEHKIAGTLFKTEHFSYSETLETHEIVAAGTTLREEKHFENHMLSLEIFSDKTATKYDYSADLREQTITRGIWNETDEIFEIVPAKSTKTKKFFDELGNEIRVENYVHTGTDFEQISWENREYSPAHKVIATEKSNGETTSGAYICTGPLWEIDANGIRTDYSYNSAKQMATKTRLNLTTNYTYDALGNVIRETQSDSAGTQISTQKSFNADGKIASETDACGNVTTYDYSENTRVETKTLPDGATEITTKNRNGDLVSITGTAVVEKFYSYEFDSATALKITTIHTGTRDSSRIEIISEDALGRIVSRISAGITETNSYSGTRLIAREKTGFPREEFEYDSLGNLICEKQIAGTEESGEWRKTETQTIFEMDSAGTTWQKTTRTISCSDATISAQTTISREQLSGLSNACRSLQISIDVRGNATETQTAFDENSHETTQTTTFPQMTGTQILAFFDGNLIQKTSPNGGISTATFDAFNRKISQTDERGNTTTFAYDACGNVISQTDANGATTQFSYDSRGNLTAKILPENVVENFTYDARGNMILQSGNGNFRAEFVFDEFNQQIGLKTWRNLAGTPDETTWNYDDATGSLLSKVDALGNAVSYTYSNSGLLLTTTNARGNVISYAYNAWREQISISTGTQIVYNAFGQITQIVDASGTRNFVYNSYGEVATETLVENDISHEIAESRDAFGRSIGYVYSKAGTARQTVGISYNSVSGQIAGTSFVHSGATKNFGFQYLAGTDLIEVVQNPNNMTLTQVYDANRDLISSMTYKRSTTNVVIRNYSYDLLGRPISRAISRNGATQNDSFSYNSKSELISATVGGNAFSYNFDEIGNRTENLPNALNQPTIIGDFVPAFDADGNMISLQTSTGTWTISWNSENRPIRFECAGTQTIIECAYDYLGRRFEKKVTVAGTVTLHQRYIYRGFLQIACVDCLRSAHPDIWLVLWDPTQSTGTRPLAIQKDGTFFTFGWDITKNIWEIFGQNGYIRTSYSYDPFGNVSESGDVSQPFQWSSEFYDSELDLVYYNYRHYIPALGRWLSEEPINIFKTLNLYLYCRNSPIKTTDLLGLEENDDCFDWKKVAWDEVKIYTSQLAEKEMSKGADRLLRNALEKRGSVNADYSSFTLFPNERSSSSNSLEVSFTLKGEIPIFQTIVLGKEVSVIGVAQYNIIEDKIKYYPKVKTSSEEVCKMEAELSFKILGIFKLSFSYGAQTTDDFDNFNGVFKTNISAGYHF